MRAVCAASIKLTSWDVTLSMSGDIFYIPPGTVCIRCSVGGEVASDAVFGSNIVSSEGRVVDGVLVVKVCSPQLNVYSA